MMKKSEMKQLVRSVLELLQEKHPWIFREDKKVIGKVVKRIVKKVEKNADESKKWMEVERRKVEEGKRRKAEKPKLDCSKPEKTESGWKGNAMTREQMAHVTETLAAKYAFRRNMIEDQLEIRENRGSSDKGWRELTEVDFHRMMLAFRLEGCDAWDSSVRHAIYAGAPEYHPLKAYLEALPEWDGRDRVTETLRRVSDDALWLNFGHRWWRAMVAQWSGRAMPTANQVAPILVSRQQGLRKSTFCRLLLPPVLRNYYTDKFDLTAQAHPESALYYNGLINMDEFDRYTAKQHTKLKNLQQLQELRTSRPRQQIRTTLPRIASFIGTSNSFGLLSDPSGSRRFFCQEVKAVIDCDTPIDYEQLYAQLLAEVLRGEPLYFSKTEEAEIQDRNRLFCRTSTVEEAFSLLYEPGEEGMAGAKWMLATEIYRQIRSRCKSLGCRPTTVNQLGQGLSMMGVCRKRTNRGAKYLVVEKGAATPEASDRLRDDD